RADAFDPGLAAPEWTQESVAEWAGRGEVDDLDAYQVSRAWYGYAQEPLPPPSRTEPGETQKVEDRLRQRMPGHMATIIFRGAPARAQTYVAERLQEEGWYDDEKFPLTGWFPDEAFAGERVVRVGEQREWSVMTWRQAHNMWVKYGEDNLLKIPLHEEKN